MLRHHRHRVALLLVVLVLVHATACLPEPVTCPGSDGLVCPNGSVCIENACLVEADRCADFADGSYCGDDRHVCMHGACVASSCGDGHVDPRHDAEDCDDGARNSDHEPDACRTSCRRAGCGDGVIDSGEAGFCLGVSDAIDVPTADLRVARGDVDQDGSIDVLGSYRDGDEQVVVVWRAGADGDLADDAVVLARIADPLATQPAAFTLADLDSDGHVDLAVGGHDATGAARVHVLVEQRGEWKDARTFAVPGVAVAGIAAADADADGVVDLVVQGAGDGVAVAGALSLCRGAAGKLPAGADASTTSEVWPSTGLSVGDVDGDGYVEALVSAPDDRSILFWGAPTGFYAPFLDGRGNLGLIQDVIYDDKPDVVCAGIGGTIDIDAYDKGDPAQAAMAHARADATSLGVLDVDEDGHPDLVFLDSGGLALRHGRDLAHELDRLDLGDLAPTALHASPLAPSELVIVGTRAGRARMALLRAGVGVLGAPWPLPIPDRILTTEATIADLDGSGTADLVFVGSTEATPVVPPVPVCFGVYDPARHGHSDPAAHLVGGSFAPFATPVSETTVDLDGDGVRDFALLSSDPDGTSTSGTLGVWRGGPAGLEATEPTTYTLPVPADLLVSGDVDGDGHPDLVAFERVTATVVVLANPAGDGTLVAWEPRVAHTVDLPIAQAFVADLAGDAHGDLAIIDGGGMLRLIIDFEVSNGDDEPWARVPDLSWLAVGHVDGERPGLAMLDALGGLRVVTVGDGAYDADILDLPDLDALDVAVADVTGDGLDEVVTLGSQVGVRVQTSPGRYATAQRWESPGQPTRRLLLDDVDGDHVRDVVLWDTTQAEWYRSRPVRR